MRLPYFDRSVRDPTGTWYTVWLRRAGVADRRAAPDRYFTTWELGGFLIDWTVDSIGYVLRRRRDAVVRVARGRPGDSRFPLGAPFFEERSSDARAGLERAREIMSEIQAGRIRHQEGLH